MELLLILVSLTLAGAIVYLLMGLKKAKGKLAEYGQINDIDKEAERRLSENKRLESETVKKREALSKLENDYARMSKDVKEIIEVHGLYKAASELKSTLQTLRSDVQSLEEAKELQEFGFYKARYSFDTAEEYKVVLERVRDKQKDAIKRNNAAICHTKWTVDGSQREGEKMTKNFLKLILRAFNGECDASIAKVKYNNILVQEARIEKAFEAINKLAQNNQCEITQEYLQLKLEELKLTHELQEKIQAEKEEQRMIREQMVEEARAQKELEKAMKDAEKQEKAYGDEMEKLRLDIESARAAGKAMEKLEQKLAEAEIRLHDAEEAKKRAISQAQLTKCGHVYVISNIGSFGEDVFKIGMTRRLDPMDRVKELGDASVPFPFDVHAMIYSEDAPGLENQLHKLFNESRLNRVNNRKEFFRVGLKDIEKAAHKFGATVEFTKIAEAKEYRESVAFEKLGKVTATSESSFEEEEIYA